MTEEVVVRDHYDKPIVPSSRVAYNYSGEVRIGFVVKVNTHKNRYGHDRHVITIQQVESMHLSKVTNRRNLVVLD